MRFHSPHPIAPRLALFLLVSAWTSLALPPAAHAGPAGIWQNISPPVQSGAAAAFDSNRQRMVVFGGDGTSIVHVATTAGPPTEWVNLQATGTPPAARHGAGLAYDPAGDRLIVFGGEDYLGHFYNDIWQLSLAGTPTWSKVTATGSAPVPCAGFGSCFDPARVLLVVFGGVDSTGALLSDQEHQIDLGQPIPGWTAWPVSGAGPSARRGVVLCDDPAIDGMIAFGGNNGSADLADAYTMSYGSHAWTKLTGTGDVPTPAANALAAFDSDDTLLFVWGGSGSDDNMRTLSPATGLWTIRPNVNWQAGPVGHANPLGIWVTGGQQLLVLDGDNGNELFDFFYMSPSNTYWQNWQDPGVAGELRSGSTFVVDRADTLAVLFGGENDSSAPVGSWWGYSLGAPRGWDDGFFTGLAGTAPAGLWGQASVWDDKRDRMLTFGGLNPSYVPQTATYELDVSGWFSPGVPWYTWGALTPTGTPPSARYQTAAIYDPAGDRMLLYGGLDGSGYARGDLWQLTLAGTPAWSPLVVAGGPTGRFGHTAIFDAPKHRMIVFGGGDSLLGGPDNDAWALALPALTWTQLAPTGTAPPARELHTAVFDSRRERMLVLGGQVASGDARDVWELNLAPATPAWTKLAPATLAGALPVNRYEHAAVYDSVGDRMLVFGGLMPPIGVFGSPYPLKDLWSLQFDFSNTTAGVSPGTGRIGFLVGEPSPNPSRGTTRVSFSLGNAQRVRAAVYDLAGRRVAKLADGIREPGTYTLDWNGRDDAGSPAAAGLYFCRVEAGGQAVTRKVMRVR